MAGKSCRNLSFQWRERDLGLGFLAVAIMWASLSKQRTALVRGGPVPKEQNRPGDVPRLYSICGTMLIEPLKTKRPAEWPGMANQRVENDGRKRVARATAGRSGKDNAPQAGI
jgi:hypothetical protein